MKIIIPQKAKLVYQLPLQILSQIELKNLSRINPAILKILIYKKSFKTLVKCIVQYLKQAPQQTLNFELRPMKYQIF